MLPCENISPNPEDAYYADGLHEEILLKLQKISTLFSVGRASVAWYRENPAPLTRMADELDVDFVGECSVRKEAETIRLTFQLLDGRSGGQIWAENYDRTLTAGSLLDIQSDLARRIARAMDAVLSPQDRSAVEARPTESLQAYNAYLMGRHLWNRRTGEAIQAALEHFHEAVAVDSGFALAWAGLADSYILMPWYAGWAGTEAYTHAIAAAERAIQIDPGLGEAHASLATIKMWYEWDFEGAATEFRRAIALAPDHATAHHWCSYLLSHMGRYDQASAVPAGTTKL